MTVDDVETEDGNFGIEVGDFETEGGDLLTDICDFETDIGDFVAVLDCDFVTDGGGSLKKKDDIGSDSG